MPRSFIPTLNDVLNSEGLEFTEKVRLGIKQTFFQPLRRDNPRDFVHTLCLPITAPLFMTAATALAALLAPTLLAASAALYVTHKFLEARDTNNNPDQEHARDSGSDVLFYSKIAAEYTLKAAGVCFALTPFLLLGAILSVPLGLGAIVTRAIATLVSPPAYDGAENEPQYPRDACTNN
ncbi:MULTISPECIES: hypothetical protein [Legionella]|uniref:hypothetical protein n=1 Tax=Legionella TaxID=445 RepID=UPI000F8C5634|nr:MULTISPECIES: hypothetical protein [Legionella]MCP0913727.1 hypothetical protein [Legionella sp. 27cVA30]RUR09624.1 hypothetical protein ELY14_08010 [Legionella septentrionalis]